MELDHVTEKERYEILAEMADLYYNQGKTQSEIAKYFNTNRFRVAKMIQEARAEQIVEIKIHYANERNKIAEEELKKRFPLSKAIVVNTQYSPYADSINQVGKVGASYLSRLLKAESVIGLTWGKTIYSVVSQLQSAVHNPVTAVQITGSFGMMNPSIDTRELVLGVAMAYHGTCAYLDAPLYLSDSNLRNALFQEPIIMDSLKITKKMDIILSGIGSLSSLPFQNLSVEPYLTQRDREQSKECIGSLYGFVLDKEGKIADIDLNKKLVSASLTDILNTPHRIVVACGRHKTEVIEKALNQHLFNEFITDSDTAIHLIEKNQK